MYQTVGHQLVSAYAACTGLPLYRRAITGASLDQALSYRQTDGDEVEDLYCLLAYVKVRARARASSSGRRFRVFCVCVCGGTALLFHRRAETPRAAAPLTQALLLFTKGGAPRRHRRVLGRDRVRLPAHTRRARRRPAWAHVARIHVAPAAGWPAAVRVWGVWVCQGRGCGYGSTARRCCTTVWESLRASTRFAPPDQPTMHATHHTQQRQPRHI